MGLFDSLNNGNRKRTDFVDPRVGICIECGSINVESHGKYIACRECKATRHFKIKPSRFYPGDFVRIVEDKEDSQIIYRIKKIKKSKEGLIRYTLKSEINGKEIPYYEGKDAHLQRVMQSRTTKNIRKYKI